MKKYSVSAWIVLAFLLVLGTSFPALAAIGVPPAGTPNLVDGFGIGIYWDYLVGEVTGCYFGLHLEYGLNDRLFLHAFGSAGDHGQALAVGIGYAIMQLNQYSERYIGLDVLYVVDSYGERYGPVWVFGSRSQGIPIPLTGKMLVIDGLWLDFSLGISPTQFSMDDSSLSTVSTLRVGAEWVF